MVEGVAMSESVQTTLEEASRCFKCDQPGKFVGKQPAVGTSTPGANINLYECDNNRCKAFGTVVRAIQVNPDGTIPPALLKRPKSYPDVPDMSRQVNDQVAAQLEAQMGGGAEIRR